MWLTGFDVPDLDVMYFIKKLRSHNLMQAIARVNRIYQGKENGLIVDYIGLQKDLNNALLEYTDRDRESLTMVLLDSVYQNILKPNLDILNQQFKVVNKLDFFSGDAVKRFKAVQDGADVVLDNKTTEEDFLKNISRKVKSAYQICSGMVSEEERRDIFYFLTIRQYILKLNTNIQIVSNSEMDEYVSKLLVEAIKGDSVEVLSSTKENQKKIFELLSLEKINELRDKNPPSIFVKIAKKLFENVIAEYRKNNFLKSQDFSEKLRNILEKYNDRNSETDFEHAISRLTYFASEILKYDKEQENLGIFGRERAFYDALIKDKDVKKLINDETLKLIAVELNQVIEDAEVDWQFKESTKSRVRIKIKECLRKYNYPPNYVEVAISDIYNQTEHMEINY